MGSMHNSLLQVDRLYAALWKCRGYVYSVCNILACVVIAR